jgi:hypothetical protein
MRARGAFSPGGGEAGFGMVGVALSLLVVALLSVGAAAAFGGGSASPTSAGGTSGLGADVKSAYDTQAQSNLSNTMQNVRAAALSNGGASGLDLGQFGVSPGSSTGPSSVSGAVAATDDGSGAVTLAVSSQSGTCWFIWFSDGSTYYGAEPDATSCTASAMAAAPTPGSPAPGAIGWQAGSFPTTG